MVILGISAFFHDSAAAIVNDGDIIAAAEEERFTRIKHDSSFPINAIKFCLEFADITIEELDAIAFYDKPLLKFERIVESYHAEAPKGLLSFVKAMPVWIHQKLLLKKTIKQELQKLYSFDRKKLKILFCEHHLSHAASTFFTSPYTESAIVTIDGVGEWTTTSISKGEQNKITVLKEIKFPHSLGLLYSSFTYYCGFRVNSGEYKLMGLAPYGNPFSEQVVLFKKKILKKICTVFTDGSFALNKEYFNYVSGLKMVHEDKWQDLFGFPRREPEGELEQCYCDLALAIQQVTEEIVLKLCVYARKITGSENICLAGGVALNCVANGKLLKESIFKNIYIQPAAGDAGGALGAALAIHHIYFNKERNAEEIRDVMHNTYLGPSYPVNSIKKMCAVNNAVFTALNNEEELLHIVSKALAEKKIVGWFQGRMEFGPRALGNRSIIADARDKNMQQKLNRSIKNRENFRPFAPVCTIENLQRYFELDTASPYMLLTAPLKKELCMQLDDDYYQLSPQEKLDTVNSKFPAITHVDLSCRVQTVSKDENPRFWKLLRSFEAITGEGILVNTSFNVRSEPIVCNPTEAYHCFMNTDMDLLVIENFIFVKEKQPVENRKLPQKNSNDSD